MLCSQIQKFTLEKECEKDTKETTTIKNHSMVAINNSPRDGLRSRSSLCSFNRLLLLSIGCIIITVLVVVQVRNLSSLQMQLSVRYNPLVPSSAIQWQDRTSMDTSSDFWEQQEQCRYFLAESGIPFSGLGIFTAIDIEEGDESQSMADICIYVADTPSGTSFKSHSWSRGVFKGKFEGDNPRGACEGVATLVNSLPEDVKTSYLKPLDIQTNGGLERSKDPGAGAITQYYGITSAAVKDLKAGSEITIDYTDWKYEKGRKYKASSRSVEWLRKYGMCIDHIEIKPASDPSMGRGAFARRALEAGSLVAPAPLQMFPERSKFARQTPEALFVNYCFQPEETNFMMYPYGPGVNLINHNSENPNVEVRWSQHHMNHNQWLKIPLNQLWEMMYPGGLILDFVAIRDIEEGEELFIDYGQEWEQAWKEHVSNWKPLPGVEDYVYPADMDRKKKFRTVEEQEKNPYPKNLATVCPTGNSRYEREEGSRIKWESPNSHWASDNLSYCNILKREFNEVTKEYEYEVSLNWDYMDPDKDDKKYYIEYGVPHSAISFADKPYTSDLHLSNAFRHTIGFPERLVPEQWRT